MCEGLVPCPAALLLRGADDAGADVLALLRLLLGGLQLLHKLTLSALIILRRSSSIATETPRGDPFLLLLSRSPFSYPTPPTSLSVFCMSSPPSLLHLTLVTAVLHIHRFSDLSSVPDHLVLHLFQETLAAGKLTEHVLRMFVATGNDEVLQLVKALRIRPVIKPILPTRCSDKKF